MRFASTKSFQKPIKKTKFIQRSDRDAWKDDKLVKNIQKNSRDWNSFREDHMQGDEKEVTKKIMKGMKGGGFEGSGRYERGRRALW